MPQRERGLADGRAQRAGVSGRHPDMTGTALPATSGLGRRALAYASVCVMLAAAGCAGCSGSAATRTIASVPSAAASIRTHVTARAADCSPAALALAYYSGGPGAGNDFGNIVLANTGATACAPRGLVRIVGLDADGSAVTNTVTSRFKESLVLTPYGTFPPIGSGFPSNLTDAAVTLVAEYRDDPRSPDGLCERHRVVPAKWRVTLPNGVRHTVPNRGRYPLYPRFASLITCRGRIRSVASVVRAFS